MDFHTPVAEPASQTAGGRAAEAAQAAAAPLLQLPTDTASHDSLLPAAAAIHCPPGHLAAAGGLGGSRDPDVAPTDSAVRDVDMGDAPPAAADSAPAVVMLQQSTLVVEELRIGRYSQPIGHLSIRRQ